MAHPAQGSAVTPERSWRANAIARRTAVWVERQATRRLAGVLAALGLAVWGQRILLMGGQRHDAVLLFLAAGLTFAFSAPPLPEWPALPERRPWPQYAQIVAGLALALAVVATGFFWLDEHSKIGLWLWLIAIPLYAFGAWDAESERFWQGQSLREEWRRLRGWIIAYRWELMWLMVILLLAAFARFYQLDTIPNGCQSDEGNNGLDALRWLHGAPYTVYAETNEGQATFFTYLLALAFKLFGAGVVQMRAVSATAGVLTVLAFYLLARDLFGVNIALAATGLLAGARWHITFSRIVYELILLPLFEVLLFYFLLRALRRGRRRDWALAGLALGGGMHTYTAWRVIPFAIAIFLVYWLLSHRARWRRDMEGIGLLAGGAYVAVVPLGVYIIRHWNVFISRIRHISVFNDVARVGSYEPVWSNLRKTLWMFNYRGDYAALNNLPGAPLLTFDARSSQAVMSHVPAAWLLASLVGALFILGIAYALRHITRPLPFLIISSFVIIGSVAVLSVAHEAPTARRPIGLIPLIFLLVGLVLDRIWVLYRRALRGHGREWFHAVLAVAVAGVYLGGVDTYFNVQARNESVYIAYSGVEAAVGRYIRTLPPDTRIYLVPAFQYHSAVKFIGGRRDTRLLNLVRDLPLREDPGGDVVYILEAVDARLEPLFRQFYPRGRLEEHRDPFGRLYFISFWVPRAQVNAARGVLGSYYEGDMGEAGPLALQRQDGPLSFDFAKEPPTSPPFSAHWTGALLAPGFGP
ncbi:MAG: glycosyltransferase family 39 protein, partial [Anaerolineae bacterium]|nr:glycosyltransferase family 39 protein [Anaerolineae bacterium]